MTSITPSRLPRRNRPRAVVAVTLLTVALATPAGTQLADAAGAKDHPMIKRYEGSIIIGYDFRKFDEFVVLTGPVKAGNAGGRNDYLPTKSEKVEGQVTRIMYTAPEGRSTLEVLRNYEQALGASGFQTLFKCAREECGTDRDGALGERYLYPLGHRLRNTPPEGSGRPPGQVSEYALNFAKDQRFLSAKRSSPQGDVYASVFVATGAFDMHKETNNHAIVLLDVVETVPMEGNMVTIDADAMAKDVAATGHVALYGILFDTDKADIKPESAPTIAEIAKFLKAEPGMKMFVVGHTDNVGGFEYNMTLSQRRAAAVVSELTAKHGIPASRLRAAAAGPIAPVAPNDTDEGRTKNRRVELVKQ